MIGAVLTGERRVLRWDRADRGEVSWAAAVGELAAIAAVFPESHPLATEPGTERRLVHAGTTIEAALAARGEP